MESLDRGSGRSSDGRPERVPSKRGRQKRSDATRVKILDAAIACLAEMGYAATTTAAVQDRAKVSRGSLFHQFRSKAELMLAVVDYVYERDVEFYDRELHGLTGDERATALIGAAWQAFSSPGGMAVLQVLIGSIGDPELQTELPAAFSRLTVKGIDELNKNCTPRGYPATAEADPEFLLLRAALRGLALEAAIAPSRDLLAQAVALLAEHHRNFLSRHSVPVPKERKDLKQL